MVAMVVTVAMVVMVAMVTNVAMVAMVAIVAIVAIVDMVDMVATVATVVMSKEPDLGVQGKGVEPHGADVVDVGRLECLNHDSGFRLHYGV